MRDLVAAIVAFVLAGTHVGQVRRSLHRFVDDFEALTRFIDF